VTTIAQTLQAFFTDRLARQRQASPHTIVAYRDTLRLLLVFAATQTGNQVSRLDIADLDAPLIAAFLDHLQHHRGNTTRTRNAAWPRSTPCSGSPRCATPNTPPTSNASWPSRRNDPTRPSSPSSPKTRSTRCSPAPTRPPGPAAATTPCSYWPPRPACEPPS